MDSRTHISTGSGATNTLDNGAFYELVGATCEHIYHVLTAHCGPHATDAMIIQSNDGRNLKDRYYTIFTKDGINIVKSIEFVSPIQKHIQELIAYIGSRVDSLSHDGTTTSMMFFTDLVAQCYARMGDELAGGKIPDRRAFRKELITTLRELAAGFEQNVITVESFAAHFNITPLEATRHIAHHQAMLSSKGDRELADAIVEVVETLPKELYGLYTAAQSYIETDKRFTVLYDDYNFVLPAISNLDNMNTNMGTEYLAETCDIIVSEDDLIPGNPALEVVVNHINAARTGEMSCDLVIITKSIDGNLQGQITHANRTSKHKIVIFTYSTSAQYASKVTILSALMHTASVYTLGEHLIDAARPYLIQNAKVHYKNRRLYVSNLYEKDGSRYHPSFTNPHRFEPYTLFVASIREALDGFTSGRLRFESQADRARYEDYVEIYRRMICAEVRQLQISGMTHDVLADRDVLQDAFGAVLSSLEHGFVLDGYLKLHLQLNAVREKRDIHHLFLAVIGRLLTEIHKVDYATGADEETSVFTQRMFEVIDLSVEHGTPYVFYPVDRGPACLTALGNNYDVIGTNFVSTTLVIQPADAYRELFRRCEDLLPKLLNTNRAIIPGTVNDGGRKS